jgi:tetratricopeptide (TPR) repeat protein
MNDWKLPPIPRRRISTEVIVEDEIARPKDYAQANKWINQAIDLRDSGEQNQALSLLQRAADLCPYETLAWILIGDIYQELGDLKSARHSYRICKAYGDEAGHERLRRLDAQERKRKIDDLINKRTPEALAQVKKMLCEPKNAVLHWSEYRDAAKKISRLKIANASDVAWALFNRALVEAMQVQSPLYTIYTEMGKQLYREGKYRSAMELYIQAFLDVKQSPPKYIRQNLERCFEKMDKAANVDLEKCLRLARLRGRKAAMQYLGGSFGGIGISRARRTRNEEAA